MDDCGDEDPLGVKTVDDAVTVDEPLTNRRIADLRDDAPQFRVLRDSFGRFDDFRGDRLRIPRRVALDV
jgi:hypothetical protein